MTGILQIAPNFGFEALRYNVFTDIESLVGFPCERSRMSRPISLSSTDLPKNKKRKSEMEGKKRKLSKGGAGKSVPRYFTLFSPLFVSARALRRREENFSPRHLCGIFNDTSCPSATPPLCRKIFFYFRYYIALSNVQRFAFHSVKKKNMICALSSAKKQSRDW